MKEVTWYLHGDMQIPREIQMQKLFCFELLAVISFILGKYSIISV